MRLLGEVEDRRGRQGRTKASRRLRKTQLYKHGPGTPGVPEALPGERC